MCISIDADSCSFSLGLSIQLTGFIQQDTWLLCLEMCSIKCHCCSGGTCQYSQLYSYTVVETLPFSVFLWKCIKYSAQQIQTSCSNKKFVREVSFTASVQGVKCDCIPNTCSEVTLLPVFVLGSDVGEFENIEHEAQWLLKNLAYVFWSGFRMWMLLVEAVGRCLWAWIWEGLNFSHVGQHAVLWFGPSLDLVHWAYF